MKIGKTMVGNSTRLVISWKNMEKMMYVKKSSILKQLSPISTK